MHLGNQGSQKRMEKSGDNPMRKTIASASVALLLACGVADANDTLDYLRDFSPRDDFNKKNFYFGVVAGNTDINGVDGAGDDIGTLHGTVGFFYKWGISLEGRFGIGSDQPGSLLQDPVSSYGAGMLRYHYTWNENVMAYVSAGAGIRLNSDDIDADSTAGVAAAVGLNLFGTKRTAVNMEFLYLGGSEASTSLGIGFHHYLGAY